LVLLALPALLLAGPALRLQEDMPVVSQEMVDHVNSHGEWVASLDWVGNMTVGQARRMLGARPSTHKLPASKLGALTKYLSVPASFDSRTQWPKCVGAIRNQGDCGSCWAFSATEVLADRICIDTNAATTVVLSPQWLVSCDTTNMGCGGGYLEAAWEYMEKHGVPVDSCDPYSSGDNDESGSCSANCSTFYKAKNAESYDTPAAIQAAILAGGPVQTAFTVYQDFMSYKSGVYVHKSGAELGGHAVKIIGWGVQGKTNYWIVANSWGTDWGLNGFFEIAWGQCGIDSDAIAGVYAN
jgi:cathepsin B